MTDDNGRAALALPVHDLLDSLGYCGVRGEHLPWNDVSAIAAAILGPRGVFLPDGLPELAGFRERYGSDSPSLPYAMEREMATLRAALDGLVEAADDLSRVGDVYFDEEQVTATVPAYKMEALRDAVATAKGTR